MSLDLGGLYSAESLKARIDRLLEGLGSAGSAEEARRLLLGATVDRLLDLDASETAGPPGVIVRDCATALQRMLLPSSEERAGFSILRAILDIAGGREREDLSAAFRADLSHLLDGLAGRAETDLLTREAGTTHLEGRLAALRRSEDLDRIWSMCSGWLDRWSDGLSDGSADRRRSNRDRILAVLGGSPQDWSDWRWQVSRILRGVDELRAVLPGRPELLERAAMACSAGVPFGVTPYYASLIDPEDEGRDGSLAAQVFPSADCVRALRAGRSVQAAELDFMRERDTCPVDLVTRRYPSIVILKPYNTCPQICTYCQRNWEIEGPMEPGAAATEERIDGALGWIAAHDAVKEVLVTGGDPLAMDDGDLTRVLRGIAAIDHVDLIRIGTRTPVTLPSRFTPALLDILGSLREPERREVSVVTHIQHPYEVTSETVQAVDSLRRLGVSVYNQMVFTFHVSRRFEAAKLRLLLRRCGVDPYYTFVPKGKEETRESRVPLARLLQEQKEEARLLPGTRRTDEVVFNVPGLGKNYLRASQHRDLLSILPDGSRLYCFHPWEKNIVRQEGYISRDVPILDYLSRLDAAGEDISDYASIWFYF